MSKSNRSLCVRICYISTLTYPNAAATFWLSFPLLSPPVPSKPSRSDQTRDVYLTQQCWLFRDLLRWANQHSHNSRNPLVSDDQGGSIKRCSKDEKQDTGRTAEISDHSYTFRHFSRRVEYISFGKVLLSLVHARKLVWWTNESVYFKRWSQ